MCIYTPYFYVIQDTRNGMYYAGAKWAQGCHPNQLLKEDGYTTSSETVKKIIRENGLDVFTIRKIKTFETANDVQNYETRFLQKVDSRNNPKFYNEHNNDHLFSYHDERYKEKMMEIYGVNHPLHSTIIKLKLESTNIERYGTPNVFCKNSSIRNSISDTFVEKYCVENISQLLETQEKIRKTSLKTRNIDHHLKDPDVIRKRIDTISQRTDEDTKNIYEKVKKTKKQKYDDQNYNNREGSRQTNLEKYGVENVSQIPEIRQKKSKSVSKTKSELEWKLTKGIDARQKLSTTLNSEEWKSTKGKQKAAKIREANKNREKKTCQHCNKIVSPTNYARWHGNNCKVIQSNG